MTHLTLETANEDNFVRLGCRAGRGLGGIGELHRLVQVMNMGKIAAQASRAVRVAEVATGVLSGLFVAVDIFFIAMDAKEIHHIRQAKAAGGNGTTGSETETNDLSTSDQATLLPSSLMQEVSFDNAEENQIRQSKAQDQSSQKTAPTRSEILKFVRSIR